MRRPASFILPAVVGFMLSAHPVFLYAQDQEQEVPDRGVARISIMDGEVTVRRGDAGEWVAGIVNAPLMSEDRIATGAQSRAEVQFDSANLLRIGANAEVRLAQLEYGKFHLQVAHGTVSFRVLRDTKAQVDIDTPTVSVRPLHPGAYRIYVQQDGQTEVTVRLGSLEVYTPQGSEHLQAGQTMLARGSASDPEFRVVQAIAADSWDRWNEDRDRELLRSDSYRYVPQDVPGAEDLDNNGTWVNAPDYGYVWSPNVGADWAPYQDGRWAWEDYYGWTWITYDAWGWAPFHYGRWFFLPNHGWCWYPGGVGVNYWSPALVGFFGFGRGVGVGVGFGFGNIGWVPLAPFERLHPWWGHGFYAGYRNPGFSNRVNVTNVANLTTTYRNAGVRNGVSSVSASDFSQGRFNAITHVSAGQIHDAGMVRGALPVAPHQANLQFTNRPVTNVPRPAGNVKFFSRTPVAPVQRVPFVQQQRALQQYSQMATNSAWRPTGTQPAVVPAQAPKPQTATPGWRPIAPPQATQSNAAPPAPASGWQRFGQPQPNAGGWGVPGSASSWRPSNTSFRPESSPSQGYRQEPLRISPPIVRERSAAPSAPRTSPPPRSSAGGGFHGGGGGGFHGGGGGGSHGGGGGGHR